MILDTVATFILPVLVVAILATFVRLWRGPQLPDRVVAMDLITALGTGLILVVALSTDSPILLDVAFILVLVTFLATIAFAFYINQRRR